MNTNTNGMTLKDGYIHMYYNLKYKFDIECKTKIVTSFGASNVGNEHKQDGHILNQKESQEVKEQTQATMWQIKQYIYLAF